LTPERLGEVSFRSVRGWSDTPGATYP
jgi:hypothetical protein